MSQRHSTTIPQTVMKVATNGMVPSGGSALKRRCHQTKSDCEPRPLKSDQRILTNWFFPGKSPHASPRQPRRA